MLPLFSGSNSPKTVVFLDCPTLKKESEFCLETTVNIYQPTGRHIPQRLEFFSTQLWETKISQFLVCFTQTLWSLALRYSAKTVPEFVMHFTCVFLVIYCIHGSKVSKLDIKAPYELDSNTVPHWGPMGKTTQINKQVVYKIMSLVWYNKSFLEVKFFYLWSPSYIFNRSRDEKWCGVTHRHRKYNPVLQWTCNLTLPTRKIPPPPSWVTVRTRVPGSLQVSSVPMSLSPCTGTRLTFSRQMTYICRTALLTSRCYILYIYSTNIRTEYFKHAAHSPFFRLQNAVYFIMQPFLVPVLFTF